MALSLPHGYQHFRQTCLLLWKRLSVENVGYARVVHEELWDLMDPFQELLAVSVLFSFLSASNCLWKGMSISKEWKLFMENVIDRSTVLKEPELQLMNDLMITFSLTRKNVPPVIIVC